MYNVVLHVFEFYGSSNTLISNFLTLSLSFIHVILMCNFCYCALLYENAIIYACHLLINPQRVSVFCCSEPWWMEQFCTWLGARVSLGPFMCSPSHTIWVVLSLSKLWSAGCPSKWCASFLSHQCCVRVSVPYVLTNSGLCCLSW